MDKLELLKSLMEQLQVTPQDVIENFVNNKVVNSNFLEEMLNKAKGFEDVTFIPSQKYVTPKDIRAGMFEYASGLISEELILGEQLRGIVGYADDKEILIWCLRSKQCCWSDEFWDAGTQDKKLRGWKATRIILEATKRLDKTAPAAQWCIDYAEDGVQKGSAFLPSYADFELLRPYIKVVKKVFSEIGLDFGDAFWSSSEYSSSHAWNSYFGSSYGLINFIKHSINPYVRPMRRILR